MLFCIPVLL